MVALVSRFSILITALGVLLVGIAYAPTVRAQGLIRDAEIEYALDALARPILNAAGLSPGQVKIMVINDNSLNAFVVDSRHIFIHSGLIRKMETPEMLQAVIAHEAAHIANGHITRRAVNARNARTAAGLGLLLSGAVAATGNAQAATGLALGTGSTSQRLFFAHTRAEESSADQSSARYMARAGVDPSAMIDVLDIFRGQEALSAPRRDPYALTHPLSSERHRAARGYAAAYPPQGNPSADNAYWYARALGKLEAFLGNPSRTIRRLRNADNSSLTLMKRAVAYMRLPDYDKASQNVNALVSARGDDPYAHELKGQIMYEAGRFDQSIAAYARAVQLSPNQPLILAGYGQALLARNTNANNRKALEILERSRARDPFQPRMLRDLAVVYARLGNNGMASLATAERYALLGRLPDAAVHAERASGLLPRGSTAWNRAQDVLNAAKTAKERR